jgi:uncharacterized membrane protein HdeD (DUF308 family)
MSNQSSTQSSWLRSYYFVRALFSIVWIALAVLFHQQMAIAALLLALYPAWDAVANFVDARVNGGLKVNPSQSLNVAVSTITTLAVIVALNQSAFAVLGVFGIWAIFSGLLQLYTGVRRWRVYGAQWVMILSGAQSALAGGHMISRAIGTAVPGILDIAPYAGFGAFYFLVPAFALTIGGARRSSKSVAA